MKGKRKIISILLILALLCCSCGKEKIAEEPEEMPAIVFFLNVELHYWNRYKDINRPQYLISFFDNQGNVYSARDPYFNEMKYEEIYDEFVEGKLNDYLTLDTTCELDELRENYELLKSVAENDALRLVPDGDVMFVPDIEEDNYWWSAFYYNEDGDLSWIYIRRQSDHPFGITYRADDERVDQIYEWLVSVSKAWK